MRLRTKKDGIEVAGYALDSYQEQLDDFTLVQDEILGLIQKVKQARTELINSLSNGLIETGSQVEVKQIATEIGLLDLPLIRENKFTRKDEDLVRLDEIRQEDTYINRKALLKPKTGEFDLKIYSLEEDLRTSLSNKRKYDDCPPFAKLWRRKLSEPRSGLVEFFETIFGIKWWYSRQEKLAIKQLEGEVMAELYFDYEIILKNIPNTEKELDTVKERKEQVKLLVEEFDHLRDRTENFEFYLRKELREEISAYLEKIEDYNLIREQIRHNARILISNIMVQGEKITHLRGLIEYLTKEIDDRKERIASISRVRNIWKRYPSGNLRGDKTKWLVTVPDMKKKSTQKRVNWSRTMGQNIHSFDRYDVYDQMHDIGYAFLAYDMFAYYSPERMPYEGFAREVFPHITSFREEHDLERADYTKFHEVEQNVDSAAVLAASEVWANRPPEPEPIREELFNEEGDFLEAEEPIEDIS